MRLIKLYDHNIFFELRKCRKLNEFSTVFRGILAHFSEYAMIDVTRKTSELRIVES